MVNECTFLRRKPWKVHHWKAHVILYSTAQSDAIHEAVSVEESAVKKSHPISSNLPPFVSYLSEFLIVFHGNCTVGQLTFSSIEPHKVTLSIPLRHLNWGECCQKVTFDLLQFHSFPCQISVSYQLFFMKLHSWKVHIFLYSTTQSSYPTGHLYFWDHCEKVISCWFLQRSRLDHLIPPHLITTLFPADTIRGADKTTVSLLSWNPLTFHIADTIRGAG